MPNSVMHHFVINDTNIELQDSGARTEISNLKSDLRQTRNLEDITILSGNYSGTRFIQIHTPISAGAYTIDVDNITSTDTDRTTCLANFIYEGGSTAFTTQLERGDNVRQDIVLEHNVTDLYLYASDTSPRSAGDDFSYTGFKLLQSYPLKNAFDVINDEIDDAISDFNSGLSDVNDGLTETNNNVSKIGEDVKSLIKRLSTYVVGDRTYTNGLLTYVSNGSIATASYSGYATYEYTIDKPTAFKVTGNTRGASNYLAIGADANDKAVQLFEQGTASVTTAYIDYEFVVDDPTVTKVYMCLYSTPADVKIGIINGEDSDDMSSLVVVNPSEIQSGKSYYNNRNIIVSYGAATLKKYTIDQDKNYYVTSSFHGSDGGFALVTYFDSTGTVISYEYLSSGGNVPIAIDRAKLDVPSNAAWMYVNSADFESKVEIVGDNSLSILFVGNSLTQDGVAYLPYLLSAFYPEVKFRFYMWYNGGYTLAQQYEKFTNDTACEIFSRAENTAAWTNSNNTVKMSDILTTYKFDIVCMQEYFNHKESYTVTDLVDWNNCRDYIVSNYTGGNGLEFISLFHSPWMTNEQSVYELTQTGNALILKNTIADDMIANGIALHMARATSLDSLGDQGHLTPDGVHAQEGLPCLLETYTTLLWLFDRLGINKSIYGLPFKMATAIYDTIHVPGPNIGTGVIEGTDAQNLLAQEVAVMAYKVGKKFVADNLV